MDNRVHAVVALNNRFVVVSNDETYNKLGTERLSFKSLFDLLKK